MPAHEDELERIRSAYRRRDASASQDAASGWADPGYAFTLQQTEWDLLRGLRLAGATIAGAHVLEVGCGAAYYLHRFAEYGAARAAGIDLMEDRVAQGRARYPGLELVAGDASALPWEDGAFSLVTQFTCLSSVFDAELRGRIAAEMWRVLEPGGHVVSYDMRTPPLALRALRRVQRRPAPQAGATPTTPMDAAELRRLFPHGELRVQAVTADASLRALARHGRLVAEVASSAPGLRTHLLTIIRKPGA